MVNVCLTFQATAKLFSKLVVPLTFSLAVPVSPRACQDYVDNLFNFHQSSEYEVVSHCDFKLHFPSD